MKYFFRFFIFAVIGVVPTVIAGYTVDMWQWWTTIAPLYVGVYMHSKSFKNENS